jgi:hypothetical protein
MWLHVVASDKNSDEIVGKEVGEEDSERIEEEVLVDFDGHFGGTLKFINVNKGSYTLIRRYRSISDWSRERRKSFGGVVKVVPLYSHIEMTIADFIDSFPVE